MSAIIVYMLTFIGICSVFGIFLMIQGFCSWFLKPNETQMELPITSTNNRRMSYVPSAPPFTARHFIVELPEEVEDSNPPAYSNFSPPSYEEAFEMFKKSYLDSGRNARRLDQFGLNELVY